MKFLYNINVEIGSKQLTVGKSIIGENLPTAYCQLPTYWKFVETESLSPAGG